LKPDLNDARKEGSAEEAALAERLRKSNISLGLERPEVNKIHAARADYNESRQVSQSLEKVAHPNCSRLRNSVSFENVRRRATYSHYTLIPPDNPPSKTASKTYSRRMEALSSGSSQKLIFD